MCNKCVAAVPLASDGKVRHPKAGEPSAAGRWNQRPVARADDKVVVLRKDLVTERSDQFEVGTVRATAAANGRSRPASFYSSADRRVACDHDGVRRASGE